MGVYRVKDSVIGMLEALIVRAFANDSLDMENEEFRRELTFPETLGSRGQPTQGISYPTPSKAMRSEAASRQPAVNVCFYIPATPQRTARSRPESARPSSACLRFLGWWFRGGHFLNWVGRNL